MSDMTDWQAVGAVSAFPVGAGHALELEGGRVVLFHLADGFHALEDVCSHDGDALSGGVVEDREVICPRHGARFYIDTGEALTPPAYEAVAVIPVRVQGEMVFLPRRWT